MMVGPLGFAAPWVLSALLGLPALWLLLRAVPPRPREVTFPGTALLLGLHDAAPLARRSPWWLLALRLGALGAVILALAGPNWRPAAQEAVGNGPLLIVMDAGWAAAPGWRDAAARAAAALTGAKGQPVALWLADGLADTQTDVQGDAQGRGREADASSRPAAAPAFADAAAAEARLRDAAPQPWQTRYPADPAAFLAQAPVSFRTLWISDGLDHPGRAALLAALTARGRVTVAPPARTALSLSLQAGVRPALILSAAAPVDPPAVLAIGPDPQGVPRTLARLAPGPLRAAADGGFAADVPIDLPAELRNRITRFAIEGEASAGAVVLTDDSIRRRKVALAGGGRPGEGQTLLSALHYVRRALDPSADLIDGALPEVLEAAPDAIVLVDAVPAGAREALERWVDQGGTLIRFSGPGLAAAADLADDPLLPVTLRPGGRSASGALSWGAPRGIAPFETDGIFAGLAIPSEVTVSAQLLPDPAPELPKRTLARLTDGTPLVTRRAMGQGQVILFHTSANAEWSNLPLSGLFVSMLDRLVRSARAGDAAAAAMPQSSRAADHWRPEQLLDGGGRLQDPGPQAPVAAAAFAAGPAPGAPAGLYVAGPGGEAPARAERRAALNAGGPVAPAVWPGATVEGDAAGAGTPLAGALLALAALLLALDAAGSALIGGRTPRLRAVR